MGQPREKWDLLNIPSTFWCYKRARQSAAALAKSRKIPIMIRHHGPRHGEDVTRVNQYIHPNGTLDIRRDDAGRLIDAA